MNQSNCTHTDKERCIFGTWAVDEVRRALEMGVVMGSFVPGEVIVSPRIKLPPPLLRSRDSLPSGAIFEFLSVANCEE